MNENRTRHRFRIAVLFFLLALALAGLSGRLFWLMIFRSDYYSAKAEDLHLRERTLKAARGRILSRNGEVLADNRLVCTISVIHNQVRDPETVTAFLSEILSLEPESVQKKVEKRSSREVIAVNVDRETGEEIRKRGLAGVKVDQDYRRFYPFGCLAARTLGFTGGDNQGVIGLEVRYEDILKGTNGKILTLADAAGVEQKNGLEKRQEPVRGKDLVVSLDSDIQSYAQQLAYETMERKNAKAVSMLVMNPQNGEIYACVNAPEFDANQPFLWGLNLVSERAKEEALLAEQSGTPKQELINRMWRNACVSDTYEPGSTFKVITAAAGLEAGAVTLTDRFSCPGFRIVEDRKIRCHKVGGHGGETFLEGMMNSCNPVLIDVGQRLGVDRYYQYFTQFGLKKKTGIDLPGEASTIMHQKDKMGLVELATVSFGQSFQITPVQLASTVSSLINGGTRITPHFGVSTISADGEQITRLSWPKGERILSEETSSTLRGILEQVVANGSGKKGAVPGYRIGGKTATSEKLPRSKNAYISSFIGFAPAEDPKVLALITIDEPQGIYYGGTIAAPVVADLFRNILPVLGIAEEAPNGQ